MLHGSFPSSHGVELAACAVVNPLTHPKRVSMLGSVVCSTAPVLYIGLRRKLGAWGVDGCTEIIAPVWVLPACGTCSALKDLAAKASGLIQACCECASGGRRECGP